MRRGHADRRDDCKDRSRVVNIFDWLTRRNGGATRAWRERWRTAIAAPDPAELASLESALRRQPPMADDLELEEEMLEALRHVVDLSAALAESRLPVVDTSHRVVGSDVCHFSAPVSIPDDPAQPTGRLLLTSTRAAFAGGARLPALPWHAVRHVVHDGRDMLLLLRGADAEGVRFRCNSFSDAVCGAAIARYLAARR